MTALKIIAIIVAVFAALFGLTFIVYMFNLDMKLMAALEPVIDKVYDKRKRDPKV